MTPPASKSKHPSKTGDAHASGYSVQDAVDKQADKRRDSGYSVQAAVDKQADKRRDSGANLGPNLGPNLRGDNATGNRRDSMSSLGADKADKADKRREAVSDKREAILGAALELFVERGFYGTAVPDIADKAGVGAGTIYRYFESKEALVNELYRREKQRFGELTIREMPTGNLIARELFRTMWMRMAKFAIANPKPFVFMELHHHAPYLDADSHALEQRMNALFSSVVVAAQARGELKAGPPQLLMSIVMGAFVGVIRGCLETSAKLEDANWSFAEQCMWEAIRA